MGDPQTLEKIPPPLASPAATRGTSPPTGGGGAFRCVFGGVRGPPAAASRLDEGGALVPRVCLAEAAPVSPWRRQRGAAGEGYVWAPGRRPRVGGFGRWMRRSAVRGGARGAAWPWSRDAAWSLASLPRCWVVALLLRCSCGCGWCSRRSFQIDLVLVPGFRVKTLVRLFGLGSG